MEYDLNNMILSISLGGALIYAARRPDVEYPLSVPGRDIQNFR